MFTFFAAFTAFTILEILFFCGFFILFVIGASFDRNGKESFKWWVFFIAMVTLIFWQWSSWTFTSLWDAVRSTDFWKPFFVYLGIGLLYCFAEFTFEIRRVAKEYAAQWQAFLDRSIRIDRRESMTLREALATIDDKAATQAATEAISKFIGDCRIWRYSFVGIEQNSVGHPEPKINKARLSECIGAWTFFWPFYLVSLIIGDLLTEVWSIISSVMVQISGRFVKMAFKDVFKT